MVLLKCVVDGEDSHIKANWQQPWQLCLCLWLSGSWVRQFSQAKLGIKT
jgi:hypothetical protein